MKIVCTIYFEWRKYFIGREILNWCAEFYLQLKNAGVTRCVFGGAGVVTNSVGAAKQSAERIKGGGSFG